MKVRKRVGKAQAREEFSALVEAVSAGGVVEITDYGKVAAVLLSEREYAWLCSCAKRTTEPQRDPRGFFQLSDADALSQAGEELSREFDRSLKKTARGL